MAWTGNNLPSLPKMLGYLCWGLLTEPFRLLSTYLASNEPIPEKDRYASCTVMGGRVAARILRLDDEEVRVLRQELGTMTAVQRDVHFICRCIKDSKEVFREIDKQGLVEKYEGPAEVAYSLRKACQAINPQFQDMFKS